MKMSIYRQQLDELNGENTEPKKDKKKKKGKGDNSSTLGKKNILQQFNEKQTKGNMQNTLLKTVADVAGIGIGTVLSAAAGKAAPILGAALIGGGHYLGDESGLLRVVGASTLAHSVAKAKEYREHPDQSIKDRLSNLKDEWLIAMLLKHYKDQNIGAINEPGAVPQATLKLDDNTLKALDKLDLGDDFGELDLSGLDEFENQNQQAADDFESDQGAEGDFTENAEDNPYREPRFRYDPDEDLNNWPPRNNARRSDYDPFDDPEIDFSNF